MCVYIYIYIYIYTHIHIRKGTNGVSTNGVPANFQFFDGGTSWVLPLTYFYIPRSARAYLSPQSVEIRYFCGGPVSVDPISPQTKGVPKRGPHSRTLN